MKKTAMIIINYNSGIEVLEYIKKVEEYTVINQIIVVDNASADGSLKILEQITNKKVKLVKSAQNLGYARGNNLGIEALKENFDYIIISNPDISIEEKTIKKCIDEIEKDRNIGIVAPRIFVNGKPDKMSSWKERSFGSDIINSLGFLQIILYPIYIKGQYRKKDFEKNITEVECVSGAFFIIKYETLKKVNFFDPNTFLFYEEDILCKKIREHGYKIFSINSEKCIHYKSKIINKTFSIFKKKDILNESRKYYHNTYNKVKKWKLKIFDILNFFRKVEILIQIFFCKIKKYLAKNIL